MKIGIYLHKHMYLLMYLLCSLYVIIGFIEYMFDLF
jgi:hypothetical protein